MMYEILINSNSYKVESNFISGAEIKRIGGVPTTHKVYFHLSGRKNGIEIGDNDSVDLRRPGAEHFISKNI